MMLRRSVCHTPRVRAVRAVVLLALSLAAGNLTAQTPNFIDEEIQARWTALNRTPAAPSSDAEFFRRIHLDLAGRLPSPEQIRAFLADESPAKRSLAIDELLETPEFTDRWTKWMLDLMHVSHNVYRGFAGRNAFPVWLRDQWGRKQRLDDIVSRVLTSTGNNYDVASGATNFFLVRSAQRAHTGYLRSVVRPGRDILPGHGAL